MKPAKPEKIPCPKCESLSTSLISSDECCCLSCLHEWKVIPKEIAPKENIVPVEVSDEGKIIKDGVSIKEQSPSPKVALYATKCAQCGIGNCTRRCLLSDLALEFGMTLEIIDCDKKQR